VYVSSLSRRPLITLPSRVTARTGRLIGIIWLVRVRQRAQRVACASRGADVAQVRRHSRALHADRDGTERSPPSHRTPSGHGPRRPPSSIHGRTTSCCGDTR